MVLSLPVFPQKLRPDTLPASSAVASALLTLLKSSLGTTASRLMPSLPDAAARKPTS